jgi:hypothetical protein
VRRYRRNADTALRRAERRFQESGDVESHARYLRELLRAGVITPERVAMAAYLGNPAARSLDIPPPPGPTETTWVYESRSHEVLDRAPITTKHATLFAADVATRALLRTADYGNSDLYLWGYEVIGAARAWVMGVGQADPDAAGEELWSDERVRTLRDRRTPDYYSLELAMIAGHTARKQPKDTARSLVSTSISAAQQYVEPHSTYGAPLWTQSMLEEVAWQDNHLAMGLLSPEWPMVLA